MGFWFILLCIPVVLAVKKECPGGSYQCKDSATCCQLLDKSYGCCPVQNAVCCDDHIHCCPPNTKCSDGMCLQSTNQTKEIHALLNQNVICPDQKSFCPEDTTCCRNPTTGVFGCCPFEDAVCCNDGNHCCPTGTSCNLEEQRCDGDGFVTKMYDSHKKSMKPQSHILDRFSRLYVSSKPTSVICPTSEFQCPDGNTCCKMLSGQWGCCPFPSATCCKDGVHCCPMDMHCDATSQYCTQGSAANITSVPNKPAKKIDPANSVCPDGSRCENFQTCCKLSETQFGCCQYANASCCSDFLHCCPSHEDCDSEHKRCIPKKSVVLLDFNNNYVEQI